ncbi:MAG: SRPBCC domain-containing protein [Gammaproteobacteria bacterium]|nr:SRPBCC domain-containing protein [Gammaproteobacteria bacterium]
MTRAADLAATARTLIRKPASEVFDAFVNPETVSKFWFTRRDDGLREGETVTWYLGARPDAPQIGVRVRSLERPRLIVMEWENAGGSGHHRRESLAGASRARKRGGRPRRGLILISPGRREDLEDRGGSYGPQWPADARRSLGGR